MDGRTSFASCDQLIAPAFGFSFMSVKPLTGKSKEFIDYAVERIQSNVKGFQENLDSQLSEVWII